MQPHKILSCIWLALVPFVCRAAIDEKRILELAELDSRSFCLSYLPKCDYQIVKPNGSNAAWAVFVSHIVMLDKWKFYPPGDSGLQLVYDENGQVTSSNADQLPLRTESTARVGFQRFCLDGLDNAKISLQPGTRKQLCICAADRALAHKMVADTFEIRIEAWTEEMKLPEAKSFVGDTIAKAIEVCVPSEPIER